VYDALQKDVPHSWSGTCPPLSHDSKQVINVKVEDGSVVDEEESHMSLTFLRVEANHEVSSMPVSAVRQISHTNTQTHTHTHTDLCVIFIYLITICIKHFLWEK
jgi:hypothetical protein